MAEVRVVAEPGRSTGSSASRRLRHAGRVPAVVYGHGMEPVPVSVVGRDLRAALSVHGLNQVLTLDVDGVTHLVLARQLQRHPVRHTLAHVDFQVVRRDEIVSAEVSLVLTGTATKVEQERGLLEHTLTSLSIRSTPEQIPQEITVDVSELEIGGALRVRDLALPRGVTTDVDPEEPVVIAAASSVAAALAAEEAAAEEAAEAAAEAAGAEAAEAAPAAEGAGTSTPSEPAPSAGEG
jgi:large subunit ribosomal protein L25